jgi:hypothetical protein
VTTHREPLTGCRLHGAAFTHGCPGCKAASFVSSSSNAHVLGPAVRDALLERLTVRCRSGFFARLLHLDPWTGE